MPKQASNQPYLVRFPAPVAACGIWAVTLDIRWPQGTITVVRHVLLIKGQPVSTDSTSELIHVREGDELIINVGSDEQYLIPDALPFGG